MAQEKIFSFEYRIKERNADDEEVSVKKEADAVALQFSDVADILAHYEAQEEGSGEIKLVEAFNKMFKDVAIANERAKLTRIPKVPKSMLERREGLSPEDQEEFDRVMAKLNLKM